MNPTIDPHTPTPRTWSAKRILKLLKQEEGSLRLMAKRLRVDFGHLGKVMRGDDTSAPMAAEIALVVSAALSRVVRPCDIWPRLYAADGGALSTASRRLPKAS